MSLKIYRTYPRLFILMMPFLGSAFFGLLFLLVFRSEGSTVLRPVALAFFLLCSLSCFYLFITIRVVILTKESVIISSLLLPFNERFSFSQIRSISQTSQKMEAMIGSSLKPAYLFTQYVTTIEFVDGKKININSIGQLDFKQLKQCIYIVRRAERSYKPTKRRIALYLLDNVDGLFWIVLCTLLVIGLAYSMITS